MIETVSFDINQPNHYYIFPYNLQKGKEVYKISTAAKQWVQIIKKETKLKFIQDEVPTVNSYIIYSMNADICDLFIKSVIKSWLKYVWGITRHKKIISTDQILSIVHNNYNQIEK